MAWPRAKKRTAREHALINGYRSGLEETVAQQLQSLSVHFTYEELVIEFVEPATKRKYTPDFVLPNGIIIETKGRFVSDDRKKHLLVQKQHPQLDIRFVFNNPASKINKGSKTSYAAWCEKHGFKYAKGDIPVAWIKEPKRSLL